MNNVGSTLGQVVSSTRGLRPSAAPLQRRLAPDLNAVTQSGEGCPNFGLSTAFMSDGARQ